MENGLLLIVVWVRCAAGRSHQNCPPGCKTPPLSYILPPQHAKKIQFPLIKNVAPTQSPGRFCLRQCVWLLIVMWARCANGQSHQNWRPGHEMPPPSYPPKMPKNSNFTLLKMKPPCNPPVDSARANTVDCWLWYGKGVQPGRAIEMSGPVMKCHLFPTPPKCQKNPISPS